MLCGDCCRKCADCDEYFPNDADGGSNIDDEWVCASCDESYTTCGECNAVVACDESYYDEATERTLCPSCRDSAVESELIHDHDHKPRARFFGGGGASTFYFGVELEVERNGCIGHDTAIADSGIAARDELYCKADGSLDDGFEIVSHPCTWEYWRTKFDLEYMEWLRKNRYRSYDTSTCGMHVHVSRSALGKRDILRLHRFFRDNQTLIVRLSRRKPGALAEWSRLALHDNRTLARTIKGYDNEDRSRYTAINLTNMCTIEFRLFRGTLAKRGFIRNLSLVVALCAFVKKNKLMTDRAFRDWLRANGAAVLGEPEATDLLQWVTGAVNGMVPADIAA